MDGQKRTVNFSTVLRAAKQRNMSFALATLLVHQMIHRMIGVHSHVHSIAAGAFDRKPGWGAKLRSVRELVGYVQPEPLRAWRRRSVGDSVVSGVGEVEMMSGRHIREHLADF